MSFYAVKVGKVPGVYLTWDECKTQVNGFAAPVFRKFETREGAEAFIKGEKPADYPKEGLVCDGGASGNPGPLKVRVYDLAANKMLVDECPANFPTGTNNQAEIIALGRACVLAPVKSKIYLDSITAITWATGGGKPNCPCPWIQKIQGLIDGKELQLVKWNKATWSEPPSDCK